MIMNELKKKSEAIFPKDVVVHLLKEAGSNVILVGGQALSYWAQYFDIDAPVSLPHISRDLDFLARNPSDIFEVQRFAQILGGYPVYPSKHALTILIGQAIKEISDDEYFNIDILHKVYSGTEGVKKRAILAEIDGKVISVMNPLDVLASRLINLHKIPQKQNDAGVTQLSLAIVVARCFLCSAQVNASAALHFYVALAKSDAGRKVASRWGIHVADAIDPAVMNDTPLFFEHQWPHIQLLMSDSYLAELDAPRFANTENFPKG